jgi:hypothetical protein
VLQLQGEQLPALGVFNPTLVLTSVFPPITAPIHPFRRLNNLGFPSDGPLSPPWITAIHMVNQIRIVSRSPNKVSQHCLHEAVGSQAQGILTRRKPSIGRSSHKLLRGLIPVKVKGEVVAVITGLGEACTLCGKVEAGTDTSLRFNIASCPSDPLALTNRLVVNAADFPPDVEFVNIRGQYIMSIM